MTEAATHESGPRRVPAPTAVPETIWFGAMVALWSTFVTLLVVSPETLADVYDWLTGLAIVWEVVMWILLLPWALAYLAWESSWEHWLRIVIVVLIAIVHLSISAPRSVRSTQDRRVPTSGHPCKSARMTQRGR